MNFILKISLGLLVLSVLVWSSPAGVSSIPETVKEQKGTQNSTNNQHTDQHSTPVEDKSPETATRTSPKTSITPKLNREESHSSPSKISAEPSTPLPETHGTETATDTASKKPDQPNQNDKSSACVHMQIYPFALTSLAVLLFSAI